MAFFGLEIVAGWSTPREIVQYKGDEATTVLMDRCFGPRPRGWPL